MAGHIVKWWKHKILGGYKQFSVLHDCQTDSEELLYPIRAPSTCSAPPDLLLTSDREPLSNRIQTKINKSPKHGGATMVKTNSSTDHHCYANVNKTKMSKTSTPNEMHLEEFSCDVSVEGGGKTKQPLQFSFTFYDLDGHHGKITKDDIAGIVYTIYESLGKSVIVPHCGSKTINVRLTVSPDINTKKKKSSGSDEVIRKRTIKPRKLINSDNDDGGCSAESAENHRVMNELRIVETDSPIPEPQIERKCRFHKIKNTEPLKESTTSHTNQNIQNVQNTKQNRDTLENIYESIANIRCCSAKLNTNELPLHSKDVINNSTTTATSTTKQPIVCFECNNFPCSLITPTRKQQLHMRRQVRKSRSRKHRSQERSKSRVRSLSVGNENCYHKSITTNPLNTNTPSAGGGGEECLNNLKRNDLIDILRESMEKNRLCFQANGKTLGSPIQHRMRSHTVSKVADNRSSQQQNDLTKNGPPTAITYHSKANLCGYDSFLHATICTNNLHSSTVPTTIMMQNQIHNKVFRRPKILDVSLNASPQVQGYTKLNSSHSKVSATAQLNLHDNINAIKGLKTRNELKLNRLIDETKLKGNKDVAQDIMINDSIFLSKLKAAEKLTEKFTESPKKTFNKEVLLAKKTSKEIKNLSSPSDNVNLSPKNGYTKEYASIPVKYEPGECDTLLRATSDEDSATTPGGGDSKVHRYVHEHIHHHYHHFENNSSPTTDN